MAKRSTIQSRLKSYIAFAGSLAAVNSADSQIIYTDVDPDDTLLVPDTYALDLNNSGGTPDFGVFIGSTGGSQSAVLTPDPSGNDWIAGHQDISGEYFASAFNSGEVIGPGLNWYNSQSYMFLVMPGGGSYFGDWLDVTNKFAGLKITEGGNQYYGWVRMDVQADPPRVIIKDYAYNSVAGQSILTSSALPVNEVRSNDFVKIRVNGKLLFVNYLLTDDRSLIMVFNALGELVIDNTLAYGINQIDCSFCPQGIYFLKVLSGEKIHTQKFSLH